MMRLVTAFFLCLLAACSAPPLSQHPEVLTDGCTSRYASTDPRVAVYCGGATIGFSTHGAQIHGIVLGICCSVGGAGTDGPYSATATGTGNLNVSDTDTQVPKLAKIGANAIAIHWCLNWNTTGDTWSPAACTDSRAGYLRAATDICNASYPGGGHPDLWFKGNHLVNGVVAGRGSVTPANVATWETNFLTQLEAHLDYIEANIPAGCHVYGVILFSELDKLTGGCCNSQIGDIVTKLHARYTKLQYVTDMPTSGVGGCSASSLACATAGYLAAFDILGADPYLPTQSSGGAACDTAPTQAQTQSRYETSGQACGGAGNFIGLNTPPTGLSGIDLMDYIGGIVKGAGKPWGIWEHGSPAIAGAAISPGSGNGGSGGTATTQGLTEKKNYLTGSLTAVFDTKFATGTGRYAGTFLWDWAPFNDISSNSYFSGSTNNFEINQNCGLITNIISLFGAGGSYDPSPAACLPGS